MKLHANVIGEGVPFLILHGFLGMGDNWKTLGKKIADHGFQVHLVDQRNHGRSPHSNNFTYELLAQDLFQYCKENDFDQIILLGHSMGGKTAMLFSCLYPSMVKKLLVADIAPKYYPLHHQDILDGLQSLDFEQIKTRGEADKALSTYVPELGTRMFLLKNLYWKEKGKLGLRMNLISLVSNVSSIGEALDDHLTFSGKTIFLKGSKSNYISEEDETLINRHFPNYTIIEVSNSGHWLHAENPDEFLTRVLEFVKN